jgi:hypothetical protein
LAGLLVLFVSGRSGHITDSADSESDAGDWRGSPVGRSLFHMTGGGHGHSRSPSRLRPRCTSGTELRRRTPQSRRSKSREAVVGLAGAVGAVRRACCADRSQPAFSTLDKSVRTSLGVIARARAIAQVECGPIVRTPAVGERAARMTGLRGGTHRARPEAVITANSLRKVAKPSWLPSWGKPRTSGFSAASAGRLASALVCEVAS